MSKIYFRVADNYMRERGNDELMKKAEIAMIRNLEVIKECYEIEDEEELENSDLLYAGMYY